MKKHPVRMAFIRQESRPIIPSKPRRASRAGQNGASANPRGARDILPSPRSAEFDRISDRGELRKTRTPLSRG